MGSSPPKIYKIIINIKIDPKTGKIIASQEMENGAAPPSNLSIIINNDDINNNIFSLFNSTNLKDIMNNEDNMNNQKNENVENISNNNEIKGIKNNGPIIDGNKNNNNNNNKNDECNKKEDKVKTDFGNEEEENKESNPPITKGNIFTNPGFFNNNEQKEEDKKETDNGEERDMNQGSNSQNELKKGNYMGFNYDVHDLEISQSVILFQGNNFLEQTQNLIDKGYYPLFIKLDNHKPIFFAIKGESQLKSLLKAYIKNMPQTDEGIMDTIELYSGKNPLDLNKQIKDLNLEEFSIITNKNNEKEKI